MKSSEGTKHGFDLVASGFSVATFVIKCIYIVGGLSIDTALCHTYTEQPHRYHRFAACIQPVKSGLSHARLLLQ